MNKFSLTLALLLSLVFAVNGQENFNHLSFKLGIGGAGISTSEFDEYSSGFSMLAGVSKNWPIGKKGIWYFNTEASINYASAILSNESKIINYNFLMPIGIKYNKNQKLSLVFGLVPTFTFASRISSDGFLDNIPGYDLNNQNTLSRTDFITSPITMQFRLGADLALNETTYLGAEIMQYFGGRAYYTKTFNSFDYYELNYASFLLCLTKRIP
jgi:hypothetical protein